MTGSIRKYQHALKSHTHDDFHQIIIPLVGGLEIDVQGKQGVVSGRTIGIVAQGERHAFRSDVENQFLVLDVNNSGDKELDKVWENALEQPFATISEALLNLTDYARYCFNQNTTENLIHTWQSLFIQTLSSELENDLENLPDRIKKVMQHIELNYCEQLTNADLASISCLSPSHFHKVFQDTMGISPQNYITSRRLNIAKRLILQGHSLAQVADDVGFSNQGAFSRTFKQNNDVSPGLWRKQELAAKK